jgi:folate-binding protein YgfZ
MEQTVETIANLPLNEAKDLDGSSVANSDEDVLRGYAAVRRGGAGMIDLSARGRLSVSGSEAVPFLNGLVTNDMKTLAVDRWMPAAFPNVQGRLIASVRIMRLADRQRDHNTAPVFLIDTEATTRQTVFQNLERFTHAGDFQVDDITREKALISLQGQKAGAMIGAVVGDIAVTLEEHRLLETSWRGSNLLALRASHTVEGGFDVMIDSALAKELGTAFLKQGAEAVGDQAMEMLRIEAGIPRQGIDMDESNIVSETNLDDAVSYTKGCYVGQEIIARIKYRGHVAKKLAGLLFERAAKIERGAKVQSLEAREIGWVTSVAYSPELGCTIALGYLRYQYLTPGTHLRVRSGENEYPAEVVDLPFVRGR